MMQKVPFGPHLLRYLSAHADDVDPLVFCTGCGEVHQTLQLRNPRGSASCQDFVAWATECIQGFRGRGKTNIKSIELREYCRLISS